MLDFLISIRRGIARIISIGASVIAIILVYSLNIKPLNSLKWLFNPQFFTSIKTASTEFAINSTIIVFIINLIIEYFRHPGEFAIDVKSKNRRNKTVIPLGTSQKSKRVDIDVKFNYKYSWFKSMLNSLGSIVFIISNPNWTSVEINNKVDFPIDSIDSSNRERIDFNLNKSISKKDIKNSIYLEMTIISNVSSFKEGDIVGEICFQPLNNKKWREIIFNILIFLFFDIKGCKHNIETS